ncbi:hypothetical protein CspeluHIS016_0703290 [Cutaneotrichosporon spelunceum]|uniref:Sugar phosphate transporter domain-containing protein n=1 Tax=Cutaneotrichosporon spelunceum TaxID=1672016 RepID=A0AAD3TZC0_9TREE|nr:hypothetical protein CspeluHIS016_0703290 [Cutaneotrichosporon spelunceum]
MTDPRQRAPFAHVSSSLDLRGYAGSPPSTSPPRFGNNLQFAFVCALCWIGSSSYLKWTARLRSPTISIIRHTLPMAFFQVGGHIFGSLAISRVPVSTVHTIKALSPCFTVAAYVLLFGVKYSHATYLSLVPLTLGVMLACSFDISFNNIGGLICAFGSTIIFVSQNIFFKKVMPSPGSSGSSDSPRLDKINLLFFSSGMAFLLMVPMWLYYDAPRLLAVWWGTAALPPTTGDASVAKVVFTFFVNGTVHFAQILIAFALLSSTSPVTYSIASLIKRIAVICLAIIWFNQPVYAVQALGICLTAVGLWMYNAAKRDVDKGEKRMRQVEAQRDGMLPTTRADQILLDGTSGASTPVFASQYAYTSAPDFLNAHPPPKVNASLRPVYHHHFEPVAIKPTAHTMYPYPSPPASTASSPPLPPQRDDPSSPVFTGA